MGLNFVKKGQKRGQKWLFLVDFGHFSGNSSDQCNFGNFGGSIFRPKSNFFSGFCNFFVLGFTLKCAFLGVQNRENFNAKCKKRKNWVFGGFFQFQQCFEVRGSDFRYFSQCKIAKKRNFPTKTPIFLNFSKIDKKHTCFFGGGHFFLKTCRKPC